MNVEQIKKHPFFYGVDWVSIRNIEAPFIPRLRSITDTSYFPTDELDQVPDEPVGGDTTGAHKELAFLGYVILVLAVRRDQKLTPRFLQLYVQEVLEFFERFLTVTKDTFSRSWSRGRPSTHPFLPAPHVLSSPTETGDRHSPISFHHSILRYMT